MTYLQTWVLDKYISALKGVPSDSMDTHLRTEVDRTGHKGGPACAAGVGGLVPGAHAGVPRSCSVAWCLVTWWLGDWYAVTGCLGQLLPLSASASSHQTRVAAVPDAFAVNSR